MRSRNNCALYYVDRPRTRLQVVSNFGDGDFGASEIHTHACELSRRRNLKFRARARVYFASPAIANAKIRDYWQSSPAHEKARALIGSRHMEHQLISNQKRRQTE